LRRFIDYHLYDKYHTLYFYVLREKGSYFSRSFNKITQDYFSFDPRNHILDAADADRLEDLPLNIITKIETTLREYLTGEKKNPKRSAQESRKGVVRRYLEFLIEKSNQTDLRGTVYASQPIAIDLEKLYIPPRLRRGIGHSHLGESEIDNLEAATLKEEGFEDISFGGFWFEDGELTTLAKASAPSVQRADPSGDTMIDPVIHLRVADAMRGEQFLMIVGEPGSGKTTLTRFITILFARAALRTTGNTRKLVVKDKRNRHSYGSLLIPIPIRIASYAQALQHRLDLSLADYIDIEFRDFSGIGNILRYEIKRGNALVLLDGLDEVIDTNQRTQIVNLIDSFVAANRSTGNKFVITSRTAPYRFTQLGGNAAHFTIGELTNDQIGPFLMNWFFTLESSGQNRKLDLIRKRATEQSTALLAAIRSRGVNQLARNPLMLTILAWMYKDGV